MARRPATGTRTILQGALVASLCGTASTSFAQDAGADASRDVVGDASTGTPSWDPLCPTGTRGCARADVAYTHRVGLPVEWDVDTGFVPAGSPVQIRFQTALAGHTQVDAAGSLEGSWPSAMTLRALGRAGSGRLQSDWGVTFRVRIRLHLTVAGRTFDWEGAVPYVPTVDLRAQSNQPFDPWAWSGVSVRGMTGRTRVASVSLTDALISIPGISGGLQFDTQMDLRTRYRSTRITFGTLADPITEAMQQTLGMFTGGPQVTYLPQLHGRIDHDATVHVFPALYVSLLGARWTLDLADIPIPIPTIGADWDFEPATARLDVPDLGTR